MFLHLTLARFRFRFQFMFLELFHFIFEVTQRTLPTYLCVVLSHFPCPAHWPPSRFIIVLVCLFIKLTHADSSQITAKWNGVPGATAQGHKDLDGRQLGAKESDIVAASTGFYWLSSRA